MSIIIFITIMKLSTASLFLVVAAPSALAFAPGKTAFRSSTSLGATAEKVRFILRGVVVWRMVGKEMRCNDYADNERKNI